MTTSLPPLHPESQAVVDIINAAGTKPLYDMTLQDARITGQKSAHVFAGKYNFKGERNEYTVPCASSNGQFFIGFQQTGNVNPALV